MGNITSSSSKESIPTAKEDAKQDVASSIDRGGRENTDERVAKRPRFAGNNNVTEMEGAPNGSSNAVAEAVVVTSERETVDFIAQPSLVGMPASIIIKIIQYSTFQYKFGGKVRTLSEFQPDILALERTCKTFRDLLAKDETWEEIGGWGCVGHEHTPTVRERAFIPNSLRQIRKFQRSTDNLLLEHLGGADGIRRIAALLLMKVSEDFQMEPNGYCIHSEDEVKVVLRGDTIAYLAEIIQGHMITRLEKAHRIAIESLRPTDGYPGITSRDFQLMDLLTLTGETSNKFLHCSISRGHHNCKLISNDDCSDEQILGSEERRKLVRALAYRAGVVKLSGEVFAIVATEVLHHMAVLIYNAYEECYAFFIQILCKI